MVNAQSPAPKQKGSRASLIFLIVIAAAIGLFYTFSYIQGQKNIENGEVGDCTVYTAGKDKPYKLADCNSNEADYKILGFADAVQKQSCLDVAGTTRTVSSKKGNVCMTDKNADPQTGINTIKEGDCMNSTGPNAKKVACSAWDAEYVVLKRADNVSKIAPGSKCNDAPGTTVYYGWGIEQTGGQYRITSVGYDRFFCLGKNA